MSRGRIHVVITVTGPLQKRVARKMTNQFGIWINTEQAVYEEFPSFYQVLQRRASSTRSPIRSRWPKPPFRSTARRSARPNAPYPQSQLFRGELVKLMQRKGHVRAQRAGRDLPLRHLLLRPGGAALRRAAGAVHRAHLPVQGRGDHRPTKSNGFSVRKIGFERFLGLASRQQPLLYGLVCVVLALFTGWLGGVVFRR